MGSLKQFEQNNGVECFSIPLLFTGLGAIMGQLTTQVLVADLAILVSIKMKSLIFIDIEIMKLSFFRHYFSLCFF